MKALLTTIMVASILVLGASLAYADPPEITQLSDLDPVYIGLGASDAGTPLAVIYVTQDDSVTVIGAKGETDFDLEISESHPGSVTNCWTYFDGSVYTGTTVTLQVDEFRETYGCVIIKFSDNSFDYAGFTVLPSWDISAESHVATLGNAPPSTPVLLPTGLPSEAQSVFRDVSEIDPSGPTEPPEPAFKGCRWNSNGTERNCVDNVSTTPICTTDTQCRFEH